MPVKIDKKLTLGDWNTPITLLGDWGREDHPKSSLREDEKLIPVMMKITQRGSMDGLHESTYMAGTNYAIPESLAKVFIKNKWAEPVQKDKPEVKK